MALASTLQPSLALPSQNLQARASGPLSSFLAAETPIALGGILANIGPNGVNDQGAASGIVIASPSTSNPDCKKSAFYKLRRTDMEKTSTHGLAILP